MSKVLEVNKTIHNTICPNRGKIMSVNCTINVLVFEQVSSKLNIYCPNIKYKTMIVQLFVCYPLPVGQGRVFRVHSARAPMANNLTRSYGQNNLIFSR